MDNPSYARYILLQEQPISGESSEKLAAGTLLVEIHDENGFILVESCDAAQDPVDGQKTTQMAEISHEEINKLLELTYFSYKLLIAERDKESRLATVRDENWLQEASMIKFGSRVNVLFDGASVPGTVHHIGPIGDVKSTTGFGVELDEVEYLSEIAPDLSDGSPFFHCHSQRAIFVSICKLRLLDDIIVENRSSKPFRKRKEQQIASLGVNKKLQTSPPSLRDKKPDSGGNSPCPLAIGDRVVWFEGGEVPRHGKVVFVGKNLRGKGPEQQAAVEFDDQVGETGYKGENKENCRFKVRQGHGRVLEVSQLMREEDFGAPSSSMNSIKDVSTEESVTSTSMESKEVQVGDDIIWMQPVKETGAKVPQRGKVWWIGVIPKQDVIRYAVEFENPCGQKNWPGRWGDIHMMDCKLNHGRLMKKDELILASDQRTRKRSVQPGEGLRDKKLSVTETPKKPATREATPPAELVTSHNEINGVKVGDRVAVNTIIDDSGVLKTGVVRWIGVAKRMGPTIRIGVEMDEQIGDSGDVQFCGTIGDAQVGYFPCFDCKPGHGIFVALADITPLGETEKDKDSREGWTAATPSKDKTKKGEKKQPGNLLISTSKTVEEGKVHQIVHEKPTPSSQKTPSRKPASILATPSITRPAQVNNVQFKLSDRVDCGRFGIGTIEWMGKRHGQPFAGIRLDEPVECAETAEGGCVGGIELFDAVPGWAVFLPVAQLYLLEQAAAPEIPEIVIEDSQMSANDDVMLIEAEEYIRQVEIVKRREEERQLNELKSTVMVFKTLAEGEGLIVGVSDDGVSGYMKFLNLVRTASESVSEYTLGFHVVDPLSGRSIEESTFIQHSPPFFVNFRLTPEYLKGAAPVFEPHCTWLPQKQVLGVLSLLRTIWAKQSNREPADRLLKTMLSLKLNLLSGLGLQYRVLFVSPAVVASGLLDSDTLGLVVCANHQEPMDLFTRIKNFNKKEEDRERTENQVECPICASVVDPGEITFFSRGCQHMFCKECVAGHVKAQMDGGNDREIRCPGDDCEMSHTLIELADILRPELMAQFNNQLLDRSLASMKDIFRCSGCQRAWIFEIGMLGNDRYITCRDGNGEGCGKQYCPHCKGQAHGEEPCMTFEQKRKLKLEYDAAGPEGKAELEMRHGKENIQHAIEDYNAEEFIRQNMKMCPNCKAPVQKSDGCNKMTCSRCMTFFCYICGVKLPVGNPYGHFSDGTCRKFDGR